MSRLESLPVQFSGSGIPAAIRVSGRAGSAVWHAPCPKCGGEDRVFILERSRHTGEPFAMCRVCGESPGGYRWSPNKREQFKHLTEEEKEAFARKRAENLALQQAEEQDRKAKFVSDRPWEQYAGKGREFWDSIGIPREMQDFWKLGYCPDRKYRYGDQLYSSPAYTIPKFGFHFEPMNMDYRLVNPVEGVGKYRPEYGLNPAPFINWPDMDGLTDEVFVLEGSKKAMVCSVFVHMNLSASNRKTFLAIPSQNSWAEVPDIVQDCSKVWYIPDPDAITSGWADAFATAVGPQCRIVEMPEKPDDMIVDFGVTWREWLQAFKYAREGRHK